MHDPFCYVLVPAQVPDIAREATCVGCWPLIHQPCELRLPHVTEGVVLEVIRRIVECELVTLQAVLR